jgi:hypothetical protein
MISEDDVMRGQLDNLQQSYKKIMEVIRLIDVNGKCGDLNSKAYKARELLNHARLQIWDLRKIDT